jgi:sugar lactone lactonase YvrE
MNKLSLALSFGLVLCVAINPCAGEPLIETIAGTGQAGDNGREGRATEINIDQPFGLEFGPDGQLYICEVGQHRVRRLDLEQGRLATVAGSGHKGYAGDGGPATEADLNEPYEVRFDSQGNLYFVEMRNCTVRRVEKETGRISTVAGTGRPGFGGDGGPATEAQLRDPHSIAFDGSGRLYIADIGNHRIRRVDPKTGRIETIAGNGEKRLPREGSQALLQPLFGPRALFVLGDELWIALREGNSIWRLNLADGTLHHEAGTGAKGYSGDGGPALKATFDGPKGIALTGDGKELVVVDTENQVIRAVDLRLGRMQTLAGSGPQARGYAGDGGAATKAKLDRPHGVCVGPDGSIYVGDTNNHRVRRIRQGSPGTP